MMVGSKVRNRLRRKARVRAKVRGSADRPRMSVFRSLSGMQVQLIDDDAGKTVVAASSKEAKAESTVGGAKKLGELIAKKAQKKKIEKVVFDRAGYKYHGKVKALADAAREGGLVF